MAIHRFRVGDLLRPEDGVSLYSANLAMAFNDLVFRTNVKMRTRLRRHGSVSTGHGLGPSRISMK